MALTMFGIRNCDTVKKARAWLDTAGIACDFHDYKSLGAPPAELSAWVAALGWETVLNRSGTTFRKHAESERHDLDAGRAMALMLAHPSMIRRPMLAGEWHGRALLHAGFRPEDYAALFGLKGP